MRLNRPGSLALFILATSLAHAAPAPPPVALSAEDASEVRQKVRTFVNLVAHDVTREGPRAWSRYFDDTPAFFMAVNGQIAFPSGLAARDGIPKVAHMFRSIELHWGSDLRIDPLTRRLALFAAPWREVLTDSAGHVMKQTGFFTGIAEYRQGRWQFRDAHWSSPVSSPASPK